MTNYPVFSSGRATKRASKVDESFLLDVAVWLRSDSQPRSVMSEEGTKSTAESRPASKNAPDQSAAILEIFRKQLDIKDQQIAGLNDVIKGMSERLREGNILMGSLQQQLSLTDGSTRNKSGVVDADLPVQKSEKGSDAATKSRAKAHWLFRKIF